MTHRMTGASVSLGLLVLRVVLGITFLVHGLQKRNVWTVDGTAANFGQMGVPSAELAAQVATYLEILGGAALILGLLSRVAGLLLAVDMAGAIFFVHGSAGFYVSEGGYEFVLLMGTAALAVAFAGPGRLAVGGALQDRRGWSVLA